MWMLRRDGARLFRSQAQRVQARQFAFARAFIDIGGDDLLRHDACLRQ